MKLRKKLKTNSRLIHTQLTKYKNTFAALCELINNSIQAKAKNVFINIEYGNGVLEPFIKCISVRDDGPGVASDDFEPRILEIGTDVKAGGQGIGRFAALQIGSSIVIKTLSYDKKSSCFHEITFPIDVDAFKQNVLDEIEFEIDDSSLSESNYNTFYEVVIKNLYSNTGGKVPKKQQLGQHFILNNFINEIFQKYPFNIFNENVAFHVNGRRLEREDFLVEDPIIQSKEYITLQGEDTEIQFYYYHTKLNLDKVKVFLCIENAGIQTVAHEFTYSSEWYTPDLGPWFIYLESPMFNSDLFRNLDLDEMADDELKSLKEIVKVTINEFFKERNKKFEKFSDAIQSDEANPLRDNDRYSPSHQLIFKKVAYLIEDQYQLLEKKAQIRELIYPLVNTAISNGEIQSIFEKVLKLTPEYIGKLRALLETTDLENVIHFSQQVIEKTDFIEFLNGIVYGELAKVLLERKQLHKILEKALWIFGESYNGTPCLWSDRQIGAILLELREKFFHYSPTVEDENLITSDDPLLNNITDLFFFNDKIADDERREIMVVELKSPSCAISQKEINQLDKYAYTIENHSALPSSKVKYKMILISSKLTGYAKSKMKSAFAKYGVPFLYDKKEEKDIELYIIEWRELLEANKRKLKYLSNGIETKEKSVRNTFEQDYPELISENVKTVLRKVKESA
ncbi:ATP-binding protein [Deminuibacter soli]|uniref:Uncharacterized protein n=1 Tax=Deminuibacter soli TaxID=2291815 RepID=A0A3E1NLC5_9BACT|nr:ATP-binding protein [Deminuibacter soli]RFM28726.1 hypothetical protein DXN05_08055 [Deminuibacter soli]